MMAKTSSFWRNIRLFLLLICLIGVDSNAQTRMAFWNVENFFDIHNDPSTADDDFTPSGLRHWTWKRLAAKRDGIAKTLIAMQAPVVVGLAEIENEMVLKELCFGSPLRQLHYDYVHYDSPDPRGIDCALLYRKDSVVITESGPVNVSDSSKGLKCRDILLVGMVLNGGDTIFCLVNHWPSKLGGASAETHRQHIAMRLIRLMDSIGTVHPRVTIVAMGDFNATTQEMEGLLSGSTLHSQMDSDAKKNGSYNYQGVWQLIDHVYSNNPKTVKASIFRAKHLLEKDARHLGMKPRRTYVGYRYHGGISDHLPILMELHP
ncbi:MAG: endonuclease [Bacteroidales bacterium]|nr:endonuclease [Bacteroidales bacterium]